MIGTVGHAALAIFTSMREKQTTFDLLPLFSCVSCQMHCASCNLEMGKSFESKNPMDLGQFVQKLPEHGLIAPYTENKQLEGLSVHVMGV